MKVNIMLKKLIRENPKALAFSAFEISRNFGTRIVVPSLSIILLELNWTNQEISYFFAAFVLGGFLFSPIIGKVSDIIGRKKIILIGLFFQIIFLLIYFYIDNKFLFYLSRFLEGIAFAAIGLVTLGAFEDIIKNNRGFWTGLFLSLGTIGALLGPLVAGYIAENYFTKILLVLSGLFLFFSLLILVLIPNDKKKNKYNFKLKDINPLSEIKLFLKNKKLTGIGILGIIINSKNEIFSIFFPILVLTVLELPKSYLGLLIAIPSLFSIFQFYFGKIADRISARFGILLGVFIVGISMIFFPYSNNLFILIGILVVYGIGSGIWNVNAWTLMGNIGKELNNDGEIFGTYTSIIKLGVFVTTLVSAYVIDYIGIIRTFQLCAVVIILSNIIVYFYFQPIFHTSKRKHIFEKILK